MAKAQRAALIFVDAEGGAFAALAAAFAPGAAAVTTGKVAVPAEIAAVLGEVGLSQPEVTAAGKGGGERVDVSGWGHALHRGDGELEKLALARIARDRIERRVQALLAER